METRSSLPWKLLAAGLVALSLVIQIFLRLPPPTMFSSSLINSLHIPLYGFVAVALRVFFRRQPLWQIAVAAFGIGFAAEVAQAFSGRSPSRSDLILNAIGISIAIVAIWLSEHRQELRAIIWASAVLIVAGLVLPRPAGYLLAYTARDRAFPVLYDPAQDHWEPFLRVRSHGSLTSDHPWPEYEGRRVLRIEWDDRRYPRFEIREVSPHWQSFETLNIELFSPLEQDRQLEAGAVLLRHTRRWTREWVSLDVSPGHNHLRLPLNRLRPDDLAPDDRHRRFLLMAARENAGEELYVGRIWLGLSGGRRTTRQHRLPTTNNQQPRAAVSL